MCMALWVIRWPKVALLVAIPCLVGSLLIGLTVLGGVQLIDKVWHGLGLKSGPLPTVIALATAVLPAALALSLLVKTAAGTSLAHSAQLSGNSDLKWRYSVAPMLAAWAFVFLVAYFEVIIPSILAPPGMTTAFERLHNLMHYGRTSALSSMVVMSFLAPLLVLGLIWGFWRGFLMLSRRERVA